MVKMDLIDSRSLACIPGVGVHWEEEEEGWHKTKIGPGRRIPTHLVRWAAENNFAAHYNIII